MKSPTPGYLVCGIGIVLIAIGIIWGSVIGYYPSDLPLLLGVLIVGAGLTWVGQRMFQAARRQNAEQAIAARDAGGR